MARAVDMWTAHLAWRRDIGADTILDDFHFPERDAFISLYPQGYCNVDKQASAPAPAPRRSCRGNAAGQRLLPGSRGVGRLLAVPSDCSFPGGGGGGYVPL